MLLQLSADMMGSDGVHRVSMTFINLVTCYNEVDNFRHMLTCSCIFCVKGLQCVLSTVGIPASVLLQAVRTVSETAQKQSKYIMYRGKRLLHCIC